MSDVSFDMSEVADLAAELAAVPARVVRLSSSTMTRIAGKLRDEAKAAAPVDTGELRDSIEIQGGEGYRIVRATAGHAYYVEFGTGDTAPQPYLWPAAGRAGVAMSEAFEQISDPFTTTEPTT